LSLKLSPHAFYQGLAGSIQGIFVPLAGQARLHRLGNELGPLSDRRYAGAPYLRNASCKTSITTAARILRFSRIASISRSRWAKSRFSRWFSFSSSLSLRASEIESPWYLRLHR
jgi:hypothetical protein